MEVYELQCQSIPDGLVQMANFLNQNKAEYVAHEFGIESIFFVYRKTA